MTLVVSENTGSDQLFRLTEFAKNGVIARRSRNTPQHPQPYSEKPHETTIPIDNPERLRLERQHEGQENWRLWGRIFTRSSLGHGARGLQRPRRNWEHLDHDQSRSRVYRWNEDGWAASATSNGGCVSRSPCGMVATRLKERAFRSDRQSGQPRRRREDITSISTPRPATAICIWLYKISPGLNIPTAGWWRKTAAGSLGPAVQPAGYRRFRRYPLLGRGRACQGRPEEIHIRIAVANRGPKQRFCICCRNCGSQHLGLG